MSSFDVTHNLFLKMDNSICSITINNSLLLRYCLDVMFNYVLSINNYANDYTVKGSITSTTPQSLCECYDVNTADELLMKIKLMGISNVINFGTIYNDFSFYILRING